MITTVYQKKKREDGRETDTQIDRSTKMKKVTIRGKITTSHTTTMAWKRIKIGTFVSIPHPNHRVLCTSQDQMPPRMPPDPLRSHIIQIKSLINYNRMAVKYSLKVLPQCPPQDLQECISDFVMWYPKFE